MIGGWRKPSTSDNSAELVSRFLEAQFHEKIDIIQFQFESIMMRRRIGVTDRS
jgi:hypothetical protein